MEIHNDVERRLAAQWVFDDPEDLFEAVRAMQSGFSRRATRRPPWHGIHPGRDRLDPTRLAQRLVDCHYSVEDVLDSSTKNARPA